MAYTTIDKPDDYFITKIHTGTGATHNITGLEFAPDFVWLKSRTQGGVGYNGMNFLFDTIRGATKRLRSNDNSAEATSANSLTSFNSDGYTLGTDEIVNKSGDAYVGWSWLGGGTASSNTDGSITSSVSANTTAGFSIVSWTGSGANATIGHGLGAEPKMIFLKIRTGTNNWQVYNKSIGSGNALFLNTTDASGSNTGWQSTDATSSVFYVSGGTAVNGSGASLIAYCFAEKKGYSKFGSYTGNGSSDGSFIFTGFKPAWVMIKKTNATGDWFLLDNKRSASGGFNYLDLYLQPSNSDAEAGSGTAQADFVSNGFKLRTTSGTPNGSGNNFIYMAFAENPFTTSTGIPCTAR